MLSSPRHSRPEPSLADWLARWHIDMWLLFLLLPLHPSAATLNLKGVAYAFGAAACWALYIVFGKRASTARGGNVVAWGMLAASAFAVPVGVAYAGRALLAPGPLLGGLAVAVLSSALPYTLEMIALRRLPQKVFGILVSASPAVSIDQDRPGRLVDASGVSKLR